MVSYIILSAKEERKKKKNQSEKLNYASQSLSK